MNTIGGYAVACLHHLTEGGRALQCIFNSSCEGISRTSSACRNFRCTRKGHSCRTTVVLTQFQSRLCGSISYLHRSLEGKPLDSWPVSCIGTRRLRSSYRIGNGRKFGWICINMTPQWNSRPSHNNFHPQGDVQ